MFSTLQARKGDENELDKPVEEWKTKHSAEEMMRQLQSAGVAAGVMETAEDLLERDPHFGYRHFFYELDQGNHLLNQTDLQDSLSINSAPYLSELTHFLMILQSFSSLGCP